MKSKSCIHKGTNSCNVHGCGQLLEAMAVWHIANPQKIEKSNPKILGTTTFHEITLWITFYGWVLKNALVFRRFISENI